MIKKITEMGNNLANVCPESKKQIDDLTNFMVALGRVSEKDLKKALKEGKNLSDVLK